MFYYRNFGKKTPLKRARGEGASGKGADHWWSLQVSSLILLPLAVWLLVALVRFTMQASGYFDILLWIRQPINTLLLSALVIVGFYHAYLRGDEILLDYVPNPFWKFFLTLLYRFACVSAASVGLYSIMYIVFMV